MSALASLNTSGQWIGSTLITKRPFHVSREIHQGLSSHTSCGSEWPEN